MRLFPLRSAVLAVLVLIAVSGSRRARAAEDATPATAAVVVDVQSSDPRVRIDRVEGEHTVGTVCWTPCGLPLDSRGVYTVAGDGILPSPTFNLSEAPPRVTLSVTPGSRVERAAGVALLLVGVAGAAVGLVHGDSFPGPNGERPKTSAVPLLIGVGGLVVGGIGALLVLDAPTRVTSSTGRTWAGWPSW